MPLVTLGTYQATKHKPTDADAGVSVLIHLQNAHPVYNTQYMAAHFDDHSGDLHAVGLGNNHVVQFVKMVVRLELYGEGYVGRSAAGLLTWKRTRLVRYGYDVTLLVRRRFVVFHLAIRRLFNFGSIIRNVPSKALQYHDIPSTLSSIIM